MLHNALTGKPCDHVWPKPKDWIDGATETYRAAPDNTEHPAERNRVQDEARERV